MAYSALPVVTECFYFVEDLRIASAIIGVYCLLHNFVYYVIICTIYGCKTANPILIILIRVASTMILMVASVALLLGLYFGNERFVHFFVTAGIWTFCLDAIGAFYHIDVVTKNLAKCYDLGFVNACVGLIMPIVLLYCIAVVNSYWQEMNLPGFNKIGVKKQAEDKQNCPCGAK